MGVLIEKRVCLDAVTKNKLLNCIAFGISHKNLYTKNMFSFTS